MQSAGVVFDDVVDGRVSEIIRARIGGRAGRVFADEKIFVVRSFATDEQLPVRSDRQRACRARIEVGRRGVQIVAAHLIAEIAG